MAAQWPGARLPDWRNGTPGWRLRFGEEGAGVFMKKSMRFWEVSWGFFKGLITNGLKKSQLG